MYKTKEDLTQRGKRAKAEKFGEEIYICKIYHP